MINWPEMLRHAEDWADGFLAEATSASLIVIAGVAFHLECGGALSGATSPHAVGVGVAALVVAEPGEARGPAQFPQLGCLLLGDAQGFVILFLSGLGMPLSTIDVSSNARRS
jgi:hypothetical protein